VSYFNITTEGLTMSNTQLAIRGATRSPNTIKYFIATDDFKTNLVEYVPAKFLDWQIETILNFTEKIQETFNLKFERVFDFSQADLPFIATNLVGKASLSWRGDIRHFYEGAYLHMSVGMGLNMDDKGNYIGEFTDGHKAEWKKVFLHELGHVLGLEHPWDMKNGDLDSDAPDSTSPIAPTIMGYVNPNSHWDEWYEPIDIYALTNIWGSNGSSNNISNYNYRDKLTATEVVISAPEFVFPQNGPAYQTDFVAGLSVTGTDAADIFIATDAREEIDGKLGLDIFKISSTLSSYSMARNNENITISLKSKPEEIDVLKNIERISGEDKSIAFDIDGNAGITAKILGAFLGKDGIFNTQYVGIGLDLLDGGATYDDVLQMTISTIFGESIDSRALVNHFYKNLLGTDAPEELLQIYGSMIDKGELSTVSLAKQVAEHPINIQNIDLVGLASSGLDYS
jgi:hypothetical protein